MDQFFEADPLPVSQTLIAAVMGPYQTGPLPMSPLGCLKKQIAKLLLSSGALQLGATLNASHFRLAELLPGACRAFQGLQGKETENRQQYGIEGHQRRNI